MRVVFMGTPEFAVPTLDALVAAGHHVVAVYSQPPRPAGRGKKLQPSPVHLAAERHGLPVFTPVSLKGADEQAAFAAHGAEVAVVAAYGLILPQAILAAPAQGCLNVHGSLLPRWRGAAPVQRAILAGDVHTGITIMQMERGLDTGPMLATVATPVAGKTAGDLTAELAALGADLMVRVLADLPTFTPEVQPEAGVTYAAKIDKAESRLDFTAPADQVERQVRAFAPAPGAFFELEGERYRVLAAQVVAGKGTPGTVLDDALTIACGQAALRPLTVQRAGRPAMDTAALLRGRAIPAGTVLA
ncbi:MULTISPECIES: methionyl-tRNA formyltransferase [unclassified Novosphingobium]|uniref:methionyl-tRNA formyltransferase n=1 Tax=unclassified Novosphingobium TaxID=2644732 RepID=UPI00146C6898|nr:MULTISPECIES: methionyl-tRNA formyltransferase [unclassified Novosphingobium]NMN06004.1 methionyl-tRNA formyltransferase [Novosphingobium sp. SG919]NMN88300.1 methionyl-tRNA formyltransferase [Novosphingobium sp. SG916]